MCLKAGLVVLSQAPFARIIHTDQMVSQPKGETILTKIKHANKMQSISEHSKISSESSLQAWLWQDIMCFCINVGQVVQIKLEKVHRTRHKKARAFI